MKRIFFSTLLIIFQVATYLSAATWSTAAQIPVGASNGVGDAVMMAPGPNAGNGIAAWADFNTQAPYYSIYNNGTWTTGAINIGASNGVYDNVYTVIGPNSGDVTAAWNDVNAKIPYYSIYNGSSWTTGTIPLNGSNGCYDNVVLAVGPNSGEMTAAWADSTSRAPYYSIYSGGTWITSTIPLGTSDGVQQDVFISQGPTAGTLMATWANQISNNLPYYSIYSSGAWGTASTIPPGSSTRVYVDVDVTQGPNSGEMVAAWTDNNTSVPYYSIYQAGSWTTGTSVSLGTSVGVNDNIYVTQGPSTGELVMAWVDFSNAPYYSLYSGGSWSAGAPIPLGTSTGANDDVGVGLLLDGYTVIATWGDSALPRVPYFATLAGSPPPPDKLPPTDGTGQHVKDRFALVIEWYNKLEWTASVSSGVVGYNIRRNGTLIAQDVKELFYTDHNRPKNGVDIYQINSLFEDGTESQAGLEIRVR